MIVDTSAMLAIVFKEADAHRYVAAIVDATPRPRMSATTLVEISIVLEGRADAIAIDRFEQFIRESDMEILPFTATHAMRARQAWREFGRGHHRARLNYGDCMAYAVAKEERTPLLYKGNDFPHTDIEPALKDGP